ncbi:MAG: TIGR04211 family SH3 domain-containing protein, partial [Pseudomonadota bacterium]
LDVKGQNNLARVREIAAIAIIEATAKQRLARGDKRQQVAALQIKYDRLKENFDQQVEQEKQALRKEIARLENLAKKPLALQQENAALKLQLEEQKDDYLALVEESEILKSPYKDRQWFITGAFVVVGSMIFGIILTRIPWQRKKRWNEL